MKASILLSGTLVFAISVFAQNRSINFEDTSRTFARLKEKAKKENKLIFIDFYTTWCGPCKKMEKEVFVNDSVADFYNKHFLCSRIDAEKGEGVELAKQYEVRAYPTFLFVSAEGIMAHRGCGFRKPKEFIQLGNSALDPEKQLSKAMDSYLKGKRDPEFVVRLIDSMSSTYMPVEKIVSDYLASQKDDNLFSKTNWEIINRHVSDIDSREFQFVLKNQKKFSVLYGDSAVNEKISNAYLNKVQSIAGDTTKDKEKRFNDFKKEMSSADIPQKDMLLTRADINFYYNVHDWKKFAEAATSGIIENQSRYWNRTWALNHFAWTFYEHVDDTAMLLRAIKWAKRSVELGNRPENNDTYANLLFKIGEIDKAIEIQTLALDLAVKANKPNVKDYEETLKKFKEARK